MSEIRKENLHESLVNEIEEKQNKTDETLITESKDLVGAINELFQNVDSGKEIIADAIDDKNVTKDSTFAAMGEAIENIHADREEDRQRLIEILEASNMELTGDESMNTLLDLIDISNINLSEIKCLKTGGHTTFIIKNDDSLWACGHNQYGVLGLGHTNHAYVFTKLDIEDVKDIYPGAHYVFIMKNDGSIWCSGQNTYGQLGLGDYTQRTTLAQVNIDNVKEFYCGAYHVIALKNDGTLWSCGYNTCGELGLSDATNRNVFTQVNITDVKYIRCGYYTSFIIKNDGSLWACGLNNYGQLGLGDTSNRTTFTQVTTNINNDVKEVSACQGYTYILKTNGEVYSCGRNDYGQLGLGDTTNRNTFTQVTTNTDNVKSIIHNIGFTIYLLKNDNTLWGCGINDKGQLALNNTTNKSTFVLVCSDVKETASGTFSHMIILKNDNTLWGCGTNGEGQLGLGDSEHKLILTEIIIGGDFLSSQIQKLNAEAIMNKGNLSTVLTDENVELNGEETLNELIILTDEKFDYMKDILFNKLIEKGIQCNEGMTFEEMINTLDRINNYSLYIYDNGVEHYPIEKGYMSTNNVATKYGTYLYCKTPYVYSGVGLQAEFTTSSKINVDNYSKLCAEAELVSGHVLQISLRNNKGSAFRKTDGTVVDRAAQIQILCHADGYVRKNISVDISNITGDYYISFLTFHTGGAYTTADTVAKCYRIWLEA